MVDLDGTACSGRCLAGDPEMKRSNDIAAIFGCDWVVAKVLSFPSSRPTVLYVFLLSSSNLDCNGHLASLGADQGDMSELT